LNVVLNFLNFNDPFDFNNFFNDFFHSYNFRNFLDDFDDSLNDLRYFDDSFNNFFYWNNFFHNVGYNNWHFERNINNFFNFFDFLNFNDFFGDFINSNNLWDLNNSVDKFFDDFFDFNKLRNNSEDFKNIIDVNNTHDLLSYHSNDSFVHLEDNACSEFDFFEFFKEGLDKNPQVEFNFSGLFTGVSVNVLDFNNLWDILDDFNQLIKLIYFDDINKLLLEEFHEFSIHLSLELGVFESQFFQVSSQKVEQVLGSSVLNWDFDGSF
jgi:hypothetical protein